MSIGVKHRLSSWVTCINVNTNRNETTPVLNKEEYNDECIPNSYEMMHSDTYLKSRKVSNNWHMKCTNKHYTKKEHFKS